MVYAVGNISSHPFAADRFRICWEACETLVFSGNLTNGSRPATRSEKLFVINKCAISVLDYCSIQLYATHSSNGALKKILNLAEGASRFMEVCRGIYAINNTSPNDRKTLIRQITLNLLNIYRLALNTLNLMMGGVNPTLSDVSLGLSFSDSAIRICLLFPPISAIPKYLSAMKNTIKNDITQLTTTLTSTLNSLQLRKLARVIGHLICIAKSFLLGMGFLAITSLMNQMRSNWTISSPFDRNNYRLLIFTQMVSYASEAIIRNALEQIFDVLHIHSSIKKDLTKWLFSIVTGTLTSIGFAVGLGMTPSVKAVLRQALPVFLSTAIGLIGTIITSLGVYKILMDLNLSPKICENLAGCIGGFFSPYVISPLLVGIGLAPSCEVALRNFFQTLIFGTSLFQLEMSVRKVHNLILNGPMTWNEIIDDLFYPL